MDTDAATRRRQIEGWRSMSAADKARLVDRWSADVRSLAEAGARARHPDATDAEIRLAVARAAYGDEILRAHGLLPDEPSGVDDDDAA